MLFCVVGPCGPTQTDRHNHSAQHAVRYRKKAVAVAISEMSVEPLPCLALPPKRSLYIKANWIVVSGVEEWVCDITAAMAMTMSITLVIPPLR